MRQLLSRAFAWAKANPKKAIAIIAALLAAAGLTLSPEAQDLILQLLAN